MDDFMGLKGTVPSNNVDKTSNEEKFNGVNINNTHLFRHKRAFYMYNVKTALHLTFSWFWLSSGSLSKLGSQQGLAALYQN